MSQKTPRRIGLALLVAFFLLSIRSEAQKPPCTWFFENGPTFVIGVAGGSASGKTTLAKAIVEAFHSPDVGLVTQDWYFNPPAQSEEQYINGHPNYDHPTAMDFPLMREQLRALVAGQAIKAPHYDFPTAVRKLNVLPVGPLRVIVFEGIHALGDPELMSLMDLKIFVDADADLRLGRRILRDTKERGQTVERCLRWYFEMVKPMHDRFIQPSREHADVVIDGADSESAQQALIELIRERVTPR